MAHPIADVITEMCDDLHEVKKLLVGNGAVGLLEYARTTRADLDELTGQVKDIVIIMGQIADAQLDHQQWHERPENLTIQQMIGQSGMRFAMLIGGMIIVFVLVAIGVDQAKALLQSWL